MSINYVTNPIYTLNQVSTFNYIYSNTLNYRYKKVNNLNNHLKLKLKYNDQGKHIRKITI